MTLVTLVTGGLASDRERAIQAALESSATSVSTAIILEGQSDGNAPFDMPDHLPLTHISRIAPGCVCCSGNLTLRVTLNRILRHAPSQLYISLASTGHLDKIHEFLTQKPYLGLLTLSKGITVYDSAIENSASTLQQTE